MKEDIVIRGEDGRVVFSLTTDGRLYAENATIDIKEPSQ